MPQMKQWIQPENRFNALPAVQEGERDSLRKSRFAINGGLHPIQHTAYTFYMPRRAPYTTLFPFVEVHSSTLLSCFSGSCPDIVGRAREYAHRERRSTEDRYLWEKMRHNSPRRSLPAEREERLNPLRGAWMRATDDCCDCVEISKGAV